MKSLPAVLTNILPALKPVISVVSKKLSLFTLWLIFSGALIYNAQNKDWFKDHRLIKDDVQNYYVYSAAWVAYQTYDLEKAYIKIPSDTKRYLWLERHPVSGRLFSKMSMGMAVVYTPFILFSHYILAPLMSYPADGYSPPYKIGLLISALIFFLIGLWQLRMILLEHFNENITALTLIVVAFGTNITWYVSSEATMSHIYSFALVLVFYRIIKKWFDNPGWLLTIASGLIFGLIVLIRPTNIMFMVLFFTGAPLVSRFSFLLQNYYRLLVMVAAFLLVWAPQLLFWKWVSGSWFHYTYGEEGFFWNNPQIISSLISYRKGWLVYTPLMTLVFIGLPLLWFKYRNLFWQVLTVLVLTTYINSSWWCWWFGGSYGNRAYIDSYGIFALTIAAVFQAVAGFKKTWLNVTGIVVLAAFVMLNLFQTWQYRMGLIHYVSTTKEAYWINFFHTEVQPNYYESLILPKHKYGVKGIFYSDFEVTEPEKKEWIYRVSKNRETLIEYYKNMATKDIKLRAKIEKENLLNSADSVYTVWAEERFNEILNRFN